MGALVRHLLEMNRLFAAFGDLRGHEVKLQIVLTYEWPCATISPIRFIKNVEFC